MLSFGSMLTMATKSRTNSESADNNAGFVARIEFIQTLHRWTSARGISKEAALHPSQLGQMLRRARLDPDGPVTFEAHTLAKIARAAGVSLIWLQTGQGSHDQDDSTFAEGSWSNLEKCLRMAANRGRWSRHTIATARSTDYITEDLTPDKWSELLDKIETVVSKILTNV